MGIYDWFVRTFELGEEWTSPPPECIDDPDESYMAYPAARASRAVDGLDRE